MPLNTPYRGGLQDERQAKNRTHIGQIAFVDTAKGLITVRMATTHEQFRLQIPLGGFSIQGLFSSWIRYMPQRFDFVKVSFGPDNTPEVVGYAAFEDDPHTASVPHQGGYAAVRRLAEANTAGLGLIFRELKEGEWDMRSSGGAEIYGTQNGTLTLAGGGGASIRLIKEEQEEAHRARRTLFEDDGVDVRFGLVKRKLNPFDVRESAVVVNPTGAPAPREWSVKVAVKPPPVGIPELFLYDEQKGDVRDDRGLPLLLNTLPLRTRASWYDATGLIQTLSVRVNTLGVVSVTQSATAVAGGISVSSDGVTPLTTNFLRTEMTSTIDHTIIAAHIALGSLTAFEPLIKGTTYLTSAVGPWATAHAAQSTLLAAFAAAFVAAGPVLLQISPSPPDQSLITAAVTAAGLLGTVGAAGVSAAVPVYTSATATSLSLKTFTD